MKALVLFITVAVVLAGCSAFFQFNAFSGLSTPPAPQLADYTGSGGLDRLQTDLASPAVVAALKNDPATTTAIENYLLTQMGGMTTNDEKQAAILYGDINLKTTDGEALVNNVVTTLVNGISASSTIHDLLSAILPADALADPTVFSAMITALTNACPPYLQLGASITDLNGNGKIDPGEGVPPGTNMGDVAQKAAVAWTVQVIYDDINAALPAGPHTAAQVISQMYLLSNDPTTADPSVQSLQPAPYTDIPSNPTFHANFVALGNLFACAGIPMPATTP